MFLHSQKPSSKLKEPIFVLIAFMLVYLVANVDIILGILLLCIVVLEKDKVSFR